MVSDKGLKYMGKLYFKPPYSKHDIINITLEKGVLELSSPLHPSWKAERNVCTFFHIHQQRMVIAG
jgi:hypothetical protein